MCGSFAIISKYKYGTWSTFAKIGITFSIKQ
jgi:hypothetical protein